MTKTEIANIALAKFREGRITTIESTTDPVAVVMNDQYDHALELLLEEHRWNFAGKRVTLTQLSDDPPFGWDHQYALPSDCIRLKDVNGEDVEASSKLFALEGRNLLTNDDTVTITYVAKIIDTNFFSPSFVEALTFKLASITCGRLTGDTDLAIMLDKQYNYALSKAIHNDTKAAGSREHNLMQRMMNSSSILGGSPLTGTGYTRTVSSTSGTVAAHKHELTDLLGTGATDGQIIIWNDADQVWEAGDAAAGGDITTDDAWVADGDLIVGSGTDTAGILPIGAANEVLKSNGTTAVWGAVAGSGDVVGDTSSTDNAIARFNGTGGKTLQNSAVTINDTTGNINMPALSTVDGRDLSVDGTKLDTIEDNADVTDETNVVAALDGATITTATVGGADKVLVQDADDTDNLKTVTAQSIADLGGGGASALADLSDVVSATNTDEFVLVANGTTGYVGRALLEGDISDLQAYITDITGDPLSNLSDVTVTAIATGEVLVWNGSAWINQTLAEAGIQPAPAEGAFIDGDKTKLDGIEASADVTDTTNVTAAGALMDSEVDANLKTLTLPASTTISTFGASLVDDADAAAARTTLESSGVTSGAGVPVSTPSVVGDIYIDTTNDNSYIAIDTLSSADWKNTATAAGGDVASDLIWDSVGDIAAANGSNSAVKRTVGTNGQVLTADSTDVSGTGLAWTTPDDWEVASTGTIDISNLPFQNAGEQLTVNEAGSALEFGLASKYIPVRKGSAGTIAVGSPVYLSGYNIGASIIEVEIADSSVAAEMPALGLAFDSITNSGSSRVLIAGIMTDLDTSGYSAGDSLYVSNAIGSDIPYLTNSRPTGTSKVQSIARVSRSNASAGSIIVQGAGRSNDIPNQMVDNAFTIIGSADATKQFDFDVDTNVTTATTRTISIPDKNGTMALTNDLNYDIAIACSDETTDLTGSTTVPLATFHAQRDGTWDEVWAGVTTAPVGGTPAMFIDVHKNGTTIFTTRPSIDSTDKSSHSADAGFVLAGTPTFVKGDLIEVFCDQIGSTTAGAGLKVYFNISE